MEALERAHRKIRAIIRRGRVKFVNDSGPVQIMQVALNGLETPDNRFRVAEFGFSSNPPEDSDAITLHIDGEMSAGVVVGTNHQPSRPKGLQPGESILYSEDGKQVYLTADGGIVVDAKGQDVVVNNAKDVTWNLSGKLKIVAPGGIEFDTPTVESTGDIQDNVNTNAHTMAQMRTIYNTHKHPVENVQGGSSTIISDVPNQTE
jgi:phage baseplate assembly protein V